MAIYTQGTNATLIVQWYEFSGGPPADVTLQTVTITRVSDSVIVVGPTAVGITQLATGLYRYIWAIAPGEVTGNYAVIWNATDAALDPVQTSEIVTVQSASASDPCAWPVVVSEECCPGWEVLPQDQKDRALRMATKVMWAATGRRYGICGVTIRPCGNDRRCGECGSWDYFGGWMRPFILDGLWRNCGCGCPCDCAPRCQIKLPAPVDTVTEVLIDGVILGADAWRVDNHQWLVRTDGECWPNCQDYNVDVPAEGTLQVQYGRGESVPFDILDAAAILACEFAKSCGALAGSCRLPGRLQTLTRQGVTASMVDIDSILKRGLTGIPEVDMIIMADNPFGHKQRPWFYSYDTAPRFRIVTQA